MMTNKQFRFFQIVNILKMCDISESCYKKLMIELCYLNIVKFPIFTFLFK